MKDQKENEDNNIPKLYEKYNHLIRVNTINCPKIQNNKEKDSPKYFFNTPFSKNYPFKISFFCAQISASKHSRNS